MTKKVRQFPFRPVPAGRYRVRFTGTPFYDPQGFWVGYRDVVVPSPRPCASDPLSTEVSFMSAHRGAPHARSLLPPAVLALLRAAGRHRPGLARPQRLHGLRLESHGLAVQRRHLRLAAGRRDADRLTFRRADDGQPAWSPDGRRLAFKTAQFGSNQLAVINADGTGETLLTRTFRFSEGQPAWSPDATKLLYRRTPENPLVQNADTWVLDVAASATGPDAAGRAGRPAAHRRRALSVLLARRDADRLPRRPRPRRALGRRGDLRHERRRARTSASSRATRTSTRRPRGRPTASRSSSNARRRAPSRPAPRRRRRTSTSCAPMAPTCAG